MSSKKINITIADHIHERLGKVKFNISAVCQIAILQEIKIQEVFKVINDKKPDAHFLQELKSRIDYKYKLKD